MAPGGRPLHDEAVHTPAVPGEADGKGGRGHDCEKAGTPQHFAHTRLHEARRIERKREIVAREASGDVQREARRLVPHESIEEPGDLARDARAHEHVIHAREQRAIEDGRRRQLHLLEKVDSDAAAVPFFREEHLREARHNRQGLDTRRRVRDEHRDVRERRV